MSLGKVQIDLEARIAKFESDMGRAARILQRDMVNAQKAVERSNNQMQQTMQRNAARMEQAGRGVATAFAGIFAVRQIARWAGDLGRVADQYNNIRAKVRLAAGENANLAGSLDQVFGVAQRTFNTFDGTAALIQRGSMALQNFGQDAETAFSNSTQLAEIFNKALVVSGAGTAEASAAALQFSQALASNKFSGDEFRSVMENNSRFAQLLADSLGVNIAKLREMSKAGELTTGSFVNLIGKTGTLDEQFSRMPLTIGRAKTQLDNAFTKFIGEADQARGASAAVAASLQVLARNLGPILSAFGQLAIVTAGAFAGRGLQAIKAYSIGIIEQARASKLAEAATRERAAADAAAASQSLLKARADQIAMETSQRAAVIDRQRIEATIALANAQIATIRANGLRATSEIELARLSQQLTATESARAAATTALGVARQKEVAINAELALSNRALAAAQTAAGVAGAASAAKITLGMRAASIATGAMTLATRALTGAVALLGGPVGIAIIAIGLLAAAFANSKAQADQAAQSYRAAIEASQNFQDAQSAAGALQAGKALLSERAAIQQRLAEQQKLRGSISPTGLFMDRSGLTSGTKLDEEIRKKQSQIAEINRQLALNRQQIDLNAASWSRAGDTVASTAGKYDEQNKALEDQRKKLVSERIELTQGLRARLEYEAMQQQGVKNAKDLDATTRGKIDAIVKEQGAIDAAHAATKSKSSADKAAIKDARQLQQAYDSLNASLTQQLALFGNTSEEARVRFELSQGSLAGAGDPQNLVGKAQELDAKNRRNQLEEEYQGLLEGVQTDTERYAALIERLNVLQAAGVLTAEDRLRIEERSRPPDRVQELIGNIRFELDLLRMTNAERTTAIQLRQLEGRATKEQAAEIAALNQRYEDERQKIDALDEARRIGSDAIFDFITGAKSAQAAWKEMMDSIEQRLARWAANGIMDQLLGKEGTSGGGAFGGILGNILGAFTGSGGNSGLSESDMYAKSISSGGLTGGGGTNWWSTAISWLGGLFGGGRDAGGPVKAGHLYEVNESRNEVLSVGGRSFLMMGNQNGYVHANAGSGGDFYQTIQFSSPHRMDNRTEGQFAQKQGDAAREAMRRNGGRS